MKRAILLLMLLSLGLSPRGHAHRPTAVQREFDVELPEVSHAIYGELAGPDDLYTVRLTFEQPFAMPLEILVPHRRSLEEHRPVYAVVGPGQPAPTPEEAALLPRPLPPGAGVFLERNDAAERLVIFESFSRRMFWSSGPMALALAAGDHEIWIFSPEGTSGDFVLGFGVEEDFSGVGCGDFASDWGTYAF